MTLPSELFRIEGSVLLYGTSIGIVGKGRVFPQFLNWGICALDILELLI